jgi:hypothetical protein
MVLKLFCSTHFQNLTCLPEPQCQQSVPRGESLMVDQALNSTSVDQLLLRFNTRRQLTSQVSVIYTIQNTVLRRWISSGVNTGHAAGSLSTSFLQYQSLRLIS